MNTVLKTENLRKNYGFKPALAGVNLELAPGRILGLMGPNGSGKTTLLKIIAGLQRPTAGSVTIDGKNDAVSLKGAVSFLADRNTLYPWMKARTAIDFYADFFTDFDRAKALEMLDFMKLDPEQTVRTMSKGMIEKLNLTLAFSRRSRLYLMDEPLGGVDPVARERIVSTIIRTWTENSSIIISTHLVTDIEPVLNDAVFLSAGEIVLAGDAETLRSERGKSMHQIYLDIFADR